MSAGSPVLQTAENGNGGNKRKACPLHGCKRVYADTSALETHMKDHEIATQSLPGKVLLCSTVGCSGSFPNMQKLMEHMRHHHKPNIFFLCESCRTKLRSYRGLLTHLHTCSKVPRVKTKPIEPTPPLSTAVTNPNMTPMAMEQNPPQLDSLSTPQQLSFHAAPQPDSAVRTLFCAPFLSNTETPPLQLAHQQLTDAAPQPQQGNEASDLPTSINLVCPTVASDTPDAQGQPQTQNRSFETVHPAPGWAPPPGSSAVWKKNHGMACSRRILWEHTKGRYTCVQCGHTVTNRKDMNQHISTQHSGNKPAEESGSPLTYSVEAGGHIY